MNLNRLSDGATPLGKTALDDNQEPEIKKYWIAIRRRWMLVGSVAGIVFASAAVFTFLQPKIYQTTAKLVVQNSKTSDAATLLESTSLVAAPSTTATQVEIINSIDLLRKSYLKMPANERNKGFRAPNTPPKWAYNITSSKDTNVISVMTQAYTPEAAADYANIISETYLNDDRDRNAEGSRLGRIAIEGELTRAQSQLSVATAQLAAYQQKTHLLIPDTQVGGLVTAIATLKTDLYTAKADDSSNQAKVAQVQGELQRTAPEVHAGETTAENPDYRNLQNQIATLQASIAQTRQTFTSTSPEMVQLRNQLAEAENRLTSFNRTMITSQSTARNPVLDTLIQVYSEAKALAVVSSARVDALNKQIDQIDNELKGYPQQVRHYGDIAQKVAAIKATVDQLTTRYFSLLIEERSSIANGLIASRAEVNKIPASPKIPLNLLLGAVLATILGVIAGLIADFLDNKIHRPEDVEQLTGLAVLSMVPEAVSTQTGDRLYIGHVDPAHAFIESFRMLRNNISFMIPQSKSQCIGVTSAIMSEGKSTVSSNLAIVSALDRKRVLLVDIDLRRPTVHHWMKVPNNVGLSNVIRGLATPEEAIQSTAWEGLDCLTSGPLPPDPTEFLNMAETRALIEQLRGMYDTVILDAPPCIGLSDMQVIAGMADGLVMVTALDRTPKQAIQSSIQMINRSAGRVLGLAINRVARSNGSYYGYYSYYSYGYAQEGDAGGKKRRKRSRRKDGTGSGSDSDRTHTNV
ncbi:hypothetical protein BH11ARM2_BH11ARM2_23680 [soil metagenome]